MIDQPPCRDTRGQQAADQHQDGTRDTQDHENGTLTAKPETRERGFKTAVELNEAGVKVALQTDSLTPMNYFPLLPMNVIKEGMSKEDALKCVTINPAEMLGIEDRVGSLEPGKDADIVIWSGDPFDFYSSVEQVFIDGKNIPLKK